MTKRIFRNYRSLRTLAFIMAAAPLFQVTQCSTGTRQVLANVTNALPSTLWGITQGFLLAPMQLLFSIWGGFVPIAAA